MKKLVLIVVLLFVCINLVSCEIFDLLSYSISGDIMDPVDGFSRGSEDGVLVFGENEYILIEELNGDFSFFVSEDDLLLGQRCNFPFFPSAKFYANTEENADYIAYGNYVLTSVFLRKDLYKTPLYYVLQDTDYEFDFSTAFIKTEDVSYEKDIEGKESLYSEIISIYLKDYPRLVAEVRIYKINEKWYFIEYDKSFLVSEAFLSALIENDLLPSY